MKMRQWSLWLPACLIFLTGACSKADFTTETPVVKQKNKNNSPNGEAAGGKDDNTLGESGGIRSKSDANGEFFKIGKSLDLYAIMDVSGSLKSGDNGGSDPDCKRKDALFDLIDKLRTLLKKGEVVRLTVVTFGDNASLLGSVPSALTVSRSELENQFPAICNSNGSTIYSAGINKTIEQLEVNRSEKQLDIETTLFFSDGAAKDSSRSLRPALDALHLAFPKRTYGILLGDSSDTCNLKDAAGRYLSTRGCMLEVVEGVAENLVSSSDANGLSDAMISLLKK